MNAATQVSMVNQFRLCSSVWRHYLTMLNPCPMLPHSHSTQLKFYLSMWMTSWLQRIATLKIFTGKSSRRIRPLNPAALWPTIQVIKRNSTLLWARYHLQSPTLQVTRGVSIVSRSRSVLTSLSLFLFSAYHEHQQHYMPPHCERGRLFFNAITTIIWNMNILKS